MTETILEVAGDFAKDHLLLDVVLILVATLAILVSMAIDLFFGVRKARLNGQATTSTGFKKTCEKARKYFSPFMVLVCIDLITCVIVPVPAFSLAWAAWCVFCEFTSVREKAWKKEELRKAERTMNIVVENKEDIAKLVAELLTHRPDEKAAKKETEQCEK